MDLTHLARHIDTHFGRHRETPVTVTADRSEVHSHLLERYGTFDDPVPANDVFADVTQMLWRWTEHSTNPMHFGLTRPTVDVTSVVADALVALYDPNLATWDFCPAANEMERHVLAVLGDKFGPGFATGLSHFTSGGQEANHTAVAVALTRAFPEAGARGLHSLERDPVMYLSEEGHHSFDKVGHLTGIGRDAIRSVPVTRDLAMDPAALADAIESDLTDGRAPFMVASTAGTINAGVIDPLNEIADVAARYGLWHHVDAAWGGAAIVSETLRPSLAGIERADSITCDAHKLFSVPAGAGMFFCKHREPVAATFGTNAAYVPDQVNDGRVYPYVTSMQWSRRFIGLKVFMMLAVRGMAEVARRIEHQAAMGDRLRRRLVDAGWTLLNDTPLPVIAFTHETLEGGADRTAQLVGRVREKHIAWISKTVLPGGVPAVRASVTNYNTTAQDIDALVAGVTGELEAVQQ